MLILVPVFGAMLGPRIWANRLMTRHNDEVAVLPVPAELARRLLDRQGLQLVQVEVTDLSAHYDPVAKAVRIPRDQYARRSLTAVTTAAHEVGHAIQDSRGYRPFRLHLALGRVARISGDLGTALLIAVPVAAFSGSGPVPPTIVGSAALLMLGTSLAAQLAALPSELNASFGLALPMLADCRLDRHQIARARLILAACSLTYVSASLNPLLALGSWLGAAYRPGLHIGLRANASTRSDRRRDDGGLDPSTAGASQHSSVTGRASTRYAPGGCALRARPAYARAAQRLARPFVRNWLELTNRMDFFSKTPSVSRSGGYHAVIEVP